MLNSLVIKNFRMLEDFTVSKLGRVNLIVGKNNSGKSTVLEALRIYAGNADHNLLKTIAASHDEKYKSEPFDESNMSKPFEDLFSGRKFPADETEIVIGESIENEQALRILHGVHINKEEIAIRKAFKKIESDNEDSTQLSSEKENDDFVPRQHEVLLIKKRKFIFPIYLNNDISFGVNVYLKEFGILSCSFIPTHFISIDELADEWDNIIYTENEKIVINALKIIVPDFEHLVFVKNERSPSSRIAKVKLANETKPIPLKSLGDGMLRILQIAIKLVLAQGGFLLIDEFENGLHYSVQEKIWRLLFEMAEKLDIQVFATTHSWDCIESFTKVAIENETTEGVLFRMGRSAKASNKGQVIATVYDKERLYNITQADIEVR